DVRTVAAKAARYFGLTLADLKSSSRQRNVVEARGVALFRSRRLTGLSFERIGAYFGGRDHTTALHNCRRTEELQTIDPATRHAVTMLEDSLNRGTRSPRRRGTARRGQRVARVALSGT